MPGLGALHLVDLGHLILDGQVPVDDAHPALARERDREASLRHRVHRRRDDGDAELDRAREPRARRHLVREDRRLGGDEQHVVEREALPGELPVQVEQPLQLVRTEVDAQGGKGTNPRRRHLHKHPPNTGALPCGRCACCSARSLLRPRSSTPRHERDRWRPCTRGPPTSTIAAFAQDGGLVAWFAPGSKPCNDVWLWQLGSAQQHLPAQGSAYRNVTCGWQVPSGSPVGLARRGERRLSRAPVDAARSRPRSRSGSTTCSARPWPIQHERRFQQVAHASHGAGLWLAGVSGSGTTARLRGRAGRVQGPARLPVDAGVTGRLRLEDRPAAAIYRVVGRKAAAAGEGRRARRSRWQRPATTSRSSPPSATSTTDGHPLASADVPVEVRNVAHRVARHERLAERHAASRSRSLAARSRILGRSAGKLDRRLVRHADGQAARKLRVPPDDTLPALSVGDDAIVFRVGRSIRVVDVKTKHVRTVATAAATPIGLSIAGRRVAWAENVAGRARIRAITLARVKTLAVALARRDARRRRGTVERHSAHRVLRRSRTCRDRRRLSASTRTAASRISRTARGRRRCRWSRRTGSSSRSSATGSAGASGRSASTDAAFAACRRRASRRSTRSEMAWSPDSRALAYTTGGTATNLMTLWVTGSGSAAARSRGPRRSSGRRGRRTAGSSRSRPTAQSTPTRRRARRAWNVSSGGQPVGWSTAGLFATGAYDGRIHVVDERGTERFSVAADRWRHGRRTGRGSRRFAGTGAKCTRVPDGSSSRSGFAALYNAPIWTSPTTRRVHRRAGGRAQHDPHRHDVRRARRHARVHARAAAATTTADRSPRSSGCRRCRTRRRSCTRATARSRSTTCTRSRPTAPGLHRITNVQADQVAAAPVTGRDAYRVRASRRTRACRARAARSRFARSASTARERRR